MTTQSPQAHTTVTITPQEFAALRASGVARDLIDVRSHDEYETLHAAGARLVPLDTLEAEQITEYRSGKQNEPIYFICKSGSRAARACAKLREQGFENVISVEGGTTGWVSAGLPVVKGRKSITMQRQTQMVAGGIVLIGAILGYVVHPGFFGLCAFVGAGLMFAGITGTCAMALLLDKMPWNQRATGGCQKCSCSH